MPLLFSRFALICSSMVVFLLTIVGLCGENALSCFSVIASDGLVTLGWFTGAIALGSVLLRRFSLPSNHALFIATAGGLGLGVFSLVSLGFGLLGWLNRPVAVSFPIVSLILCIVDSKIGGKSFQQWNRSTIEQWLRSPARSSWLWLIPVASLAIAAVAASLLPGLLWKPLDPHPYDVTSYHLLVPREWYEGGRIVPLAHNVFSYFPFNVEMQFLLLMHAMGGPFVGMYACQFVCLGYAALMVLAVYGAGKRSASHAQLSNLNQTSRAVNGSSEHGAFAPAFAAAAVATVPWFIMLSGVAYVETALMLYTALAIAWALHAMATPAHLLRAAILSGVLAGFACGVKITAVPMLLLAVPVALGMTLLFRRSIEVPTRKIVLACIAVGIAGLLALSPWLIRNWIWCGNPLFPVAMRLLGHDHFSPEQMVRFAVAHSPTAGEQPFTSRLSILWTDVIAHWQFGFLILPAGLIACVNRVGERSTWLLIICGMFVLIVWIGFTHLLPRFLVMMIPIAGIALARIEWGRAWPVAIVFVLVAAGVSYSFVMPRLCEQSNPPLYRGEPRIAFFGTGSSEALSALLMPEDWVKSPDPKMQVALVGDAQAFLYQMPMSQIHYRSVFNVAGGTDDPIDAWVGPQVRGDPDWYLVINPMEVARLHGTYRNMPAVPPQWEPQLEAGKTFVLRGNEVPKK